MRVKICGLTTAEAVDAAVSAGAAYCGFNFYKPSPRYVVPDQAKALMDRMPAGRMKVALVVDEDDARIEALLDALPFDMLQLNGSESVARVAAVKARFGLPVMKALPVATESDLAAIDAFSAVADQLLIDAKPVAGGLPGGNGLAFDWNLIAGRRWSRPWMLAGGLNAGNVAEAVRLTGAQQVDLSSGVESAPGIKDPEKIRAFMRAAG